MKIQTERQRQDIASAMKMVNSNALNVRGLILHFKALDAGLTCEQKERLDRIYYYCNNLISAIDQLWVLI